MLAANSDTDLIHRAQLAMLERRRSGARRIEGSALFEQDGLLFERSAPELAFLNGVTATRIPADWGTVLQRATEYFGATGPRWALFASGEIAQSLSEAAPSLGLTLSFSEPGMLFAPLAGDPAAVPGLTIEMVRDQRSLADFCAASRLGFGQPGGEWEMMYPADVLNAPDLTLYVGRVDGAPVASSLRSSSHRIAVIGGVGTAPAYRGRGIGAAMTWRAALDGIPEGCLAAYLAASPMGAPVYTRMGFRAVSVYQRWQPDADLPIDGHPPPGATLA